MKTFRLFGVFLCLALLSGLLCTPASAATEVPPYAMDNDVRTRADISSVTIDAEVTRFLNIKFWETPVDFTVSGEGFSQSYGGEFLHRAIKLEEPICGEVTITFSKTVAVSEIEISDTVPADAQFWEQNGSECDLLIFSTHADDEQLFFAGVLPLYATNKNCETQVVYFTNHYDFPVRRHELLDGLWAVGVTRYPVLSEFPDAYAASREAAVKNLEKAGYTELDALAFQIEQIRRFRPQVILGHDLAGEYGHGQHILNATLLTRAVELANDSEEHTESAGKYGVYNTPKLYLHSYSENTITLGLDTPIEGLNKTPYELSREGYSKHRSQAEFWFTAWLCGKNGEYSSATQIEKYSPLYWGLYRSTVGEDIAKNDIFENLTFRSLQPEPPAAEEPQDTLYPEPQIENEPNKALEYIIAALFMAAATCLIVLEIRNKK